MLTGLPDELPTQNNGGVFRSGKIFSFCLTIAVCLQITGISLAGQTGGGVGSLLNKNLRFRNLTVSSVVSATVLFRNSKANRSLVYISYNPFYTLHYPEKLH